MKPIGAAVQIADGCLNCPYCADEVVLVNVIGAEMHTVHIVFRCYGCKKAMSLELMSCSAGHTHMTWMEGGAEGSVGVREVLGAVRRQEEPPETDETLN